MTERAAPGQYSGLGSEPRDVSATQYDVQLLAAGQVAIADEQAAMRKGLVAIAKALDVDHSVLERPEADALRNVRARLLALQGANPSVQTILAGIQASKRAALTGQAQDAIAAAGPRPSSADLSYLTALHEQGPYGSGNR